MLEELPNPITLSSEEDKRDKDKGREKPKRDDQGRKERGGPKTPRPGPDERDGLDGGPIVDPS